MKKLPWQHELRHHGVLGQKWGRRNGPPYPLAPGRHSAAEKKAGWQKSLKSKSKSQGNIPGGGGGGKKPDELTEEEKKMLEKFYKDLEEHLEWIKERHGDDVSPLEMISSQNFGLTLGEISGYELTAEQEEKFRKAAFDHYSKNSTQKNLHESNYAINEGVLKLDQVSRDSKVLNELYKGLEDTAKRMGRTPEEQLKSQEFSVTLAEEAGVDGLSKSDLERLRKQALNHYKGQSNINGKNYVIKDGEVYDRVVKNGVTVDTPVGDNPSAKKIIDSNITLEIDSNGRLTDSPKNKEFIDTAKKWINDTFKSEITWEIEDED